MAQDLARLVVTLEAQNAKYLKKLETSERKLGRFEKKTNKSLAGIEKRWKKMGASLKVAVGGVALAGLTRKIVAATKKQEQAVAQLEAGLASTGGAVGHSIDELKAKAEELQKSTTFGDEDILQAQAQLLTFTKVTGEAFDETIEAALNLSARFGTDLKSSVIQLGKAMNDPLTQMSALSRSGVTFTKTQTDMAKALVKNGDLLGAQKIILKELESQFGGSAAAARDTFGGALEGLGNAFGDLLEADGGGLNDAKKSIEELTTLLQDPATKEGANQIASGIAKMAASAASFVTQVPGLLAFFRAEINANFLDFIDPDDLVRLDDKVVELNKEIAETERLLNKATAAQAQGFNQFGAIDSFSEKLKGLQAESKTFAGILERAQARVVAGAPEGGEGGGSKSGGKKTPGFTPDISGLDAAMKKEQAYLKSIIARGEAVRNSVLLPNERYAEQMKELNGLLSESVIGQDTFNRKQAEYKATLDESLGVTDLHQEALRILAEQMDPLDAQLQALADDQLLLNKAWLEGQISADQLALGVASIDQKMVELGDGVEEVASDMSVFADQAARNMQDSFSDFLFDPFEDGLSGLADNFAKTLQRMAADAASAKLFEQLGVENFLSGGSSGEAGGIGKALDFFGGFFAEGGRPDPYKASIVGEAGPEMFIPDGISGQIVPYHELISGGGGGREVTVNQSIQVSGTPDNRSAMQMAQETGAAMRRAQRLSG